MSPTATLADTPLELKCYSNKELMETIEKLPVITLFNGKNQKGKTEEVMLDLERKSAYTIEYDPSANGNALAAKEYCVTKVNTVININDSAIEFFAKLIERMKGQKI